MGQFSERFRASSPDSRNMDTLVKHAKALRARAATDPDYVEFVAKNMERIAEEYAECFEKMREARQVVFATRDLLQDIHDFGKVVKE